MSPCRRPAFRKVCSDYNHCRRCVKHFRGRLSRPAAAVVLGLEEMARGALDVRSLQEYQQDLAAVR
jgi:hypothetical protein